MSTPNPYAPPRGGVRDIAEPTTGAELADRVTRLVASILDSIVVAALIYVPFFIGLLAVGGSLQAGVPPAPTAFAAAFVLAFVGFVIWAFLTVRYVVKNGQSIAKKLLGIKVVRVSGERASFSRIFWLRNVVNGVLSIIPFYGLIDVLLIFGEDRRCLHDKIANTIVVKV